MNELSIITYHYIRELELTKYPQINGLPLSRFNEQLKYIKKHYEFVNIDDVISCIYYEKNDLPQNAVLLTFDDGYIDHYNNVLPLLLENKIQGSFFPAAKPILENKILDVNKIHFILASCKDEKIIVKYIYSYLDEFRTEYNLKSNDYYYSKLAFSSRTGTSEGLDSFDTIFIKRILQAELVQPLREMIIDRLFKKYVTNDESAFSSELYMNMNQLKEMVRNGMYIGNHGYSHCWMDLLSEQKQKIEIDLSINFLKQIGASTDKWVMCYPYGRYNDSLIKIIKEKKCQLGLTINSGIAKLSQRNSFTLERIDTNEFSEMSFQ